MPTESGLDGYRYPSVQPPESVVLHRPPQRAEGKKGVRQRTEYRQQVFSVGFIERRLSGTTWRPSTLRPTLRTTRTADRYGQRIFSGPYEGYSENRKTE